MEDELELDEGGGENCTCFLLALLAELNSAMSVLNARSASASAVTPAVADEAFVEDLSERRSSPTSTVK